MLCLQLYSMFCSLPIILLPVYLRLFLSGKSFKGKPHCVCPKECVLVSKNVHNRHLNICSPLGSTVSKLTGSIPLLEEICHWGQALKLVAWPNFLFSLCFLLVQCDLSSVTNGFPARMDCVHLGP